MPLETAAFTSAMDILTKEIRSFHNDFKQSFHFLINAINISHEQQNASPVAPTPPVSQLDLFATQTSDARPSGRANFQFPSDERSSENDFEAKVLHCINQKSAEWKKLIKEYEFNYHKSIRNSGLSSKYKEFLERDPPFFQKNSDPPQPTQ